MTNYNWKESADFWRERANKFERALYAIIACNSGYPSTTVVDMWEIAQNALEESKND